MHEEERKSRSTYTMAYGEIGNELNEIMIIL